MDWCEANGVDYLFGLTGTKALAAKVEAVADDITCAHETDQPCGVVGPSFLAQRGAVRTLAAPVAGHVTRCASCQPVRLEPTGRGDVGRAANAPRLSHVYPLGSRPVPPLTQLFDFSVVLLGEVT